MAGAAVKSLQQRLEESKRSGSEKDALTAHLRTHVRQLEEAVQKACREADEKEARREREYNMLQDVSLAGLWNREQVHYRELRFHRYGLLKTGSDIFGLKLIIFCACVPISLDFFFFTKLDYCH